MEAATAPRRSRSAEPRLLRVGRRVMDAALNVYAALALVYLLVPVAIILLFSFNDTKSRFNFIWQGFTLDHWKDPFKFKDLTDALVTSIQVAALATIVATLLGTLMALALVRYQFRGRSATQPLHLHPAGHARGGAGSLAAVAVHLGGLRARVRDAS